MIKYKIYGEEKEERDKIVYFKLKKIGDDSICLTAVDENGEVVSRGNILEIKDGHIYTIPSASDEIGLDLGKEDRVKID